MTADEMGRAVANLAAAVEAAADNNRPHPCRGHSERWLSDNRRVREAAALECAGCWPVLWAACATVGRFHEFGTWAGADVTPARPHRRRPTMPG